MSNDGPAPGRTCLGPLPRRARRPPNEVLERDVFPARRPHRPASAPRVAIRLARWLVAAARYRFAILADGLSGRRGPRWRAIRLREALEWIGGTAIKFGQQVSIRVDMLPPEYCAELASMLDQIPPFPFEEARDRIETAARRPLADAYQAIDPSPIGSASVACVFQAFLTSGEKVAIKVRRPNVVDTFNADITAVDWLLHLQEILTLVRPGMVRHMRTELRNMFMEELDFAAEARYQAIFRKEARRDRLHFVTAPRVHADLSNEEVLVTEFVEGPSMVEVLRISESEDLVAKAALARQDIDPRVLGRRLIQVCWWGQFEAPVFHGDPHPANVIVQPGNRLAFIDFGACGSISAKTRRTMLEIAQRNLRNDVTGAAALQIQFMTPLPPLDVRALRKRLEDVAWRRLLILRDKDTPWHQRTTAASFLDLMHVSKRFNLPVHMDTVRVVRCSLLYDTISCRLDPGSNLDDFEAYFKDRNRRLERRAERDAKREYQLHQLVDQAGEIADGARLVATHLEIAAQSLPKEFLSLSNKQSYSISVALRFLTTLAIVAGLASGLARLQAWLTGDDSTTLAEHARGVVANPVFLLVAVALLFVTARRILYRLTDLAPPGRRRGR